MKGKFYQTPDGNLTVLTLDQDEILIWVHGTNYLVTNPSTQNPIHADRIGQIEFNNLMTPEEIKALIDDYVKNNSH